MRLCAMTNTAARLIGGDTAHAACKLSSKRCKQQNKHMRFENAKAWQEEWYNTIALALDEVSMVAAEQYCEKDSQMRIAKCMP